MSQLSVSYVKRKSCNFEKQEDLNRKWFAKTKSNIFRALVTLPATLLILPSDAKHLSNHTDSDAIYLSERSPEGLRVM